MDLGLSGKVAVVTGGSRGIGRATAVSLAEEGCRVAICGRDEEVLRRTVDELGSLTDHVWGRRADVTQSEDVNAFVDGASENLGGIDAVVCNVGGFSPNPPKDVLGDSP